MNASAKKLNLFGIVLLLAGLILFGFQRNQVQDLREQKTGLNLHSSTTQSAPGPKAKQKEEPISPSEWQAWQEQRKELIKLRGEIGFLREEGKKADKLTSHFDRLEAEQRRKKASKEAERNQPGFIPMEQWRNAG